AVVTNFGRRMASQDARRPAASREPCAGYDWKRIAHHAQAVSADRRSMAASFVHGWPRRMSCGRYGIRQNDAGFGAYACTATYRLVTRPKPPCCSSVAAGELDVGNRKVCPNP